MGAKVDEVMARTDGNHALEELYRVLMDAKFDFMPDGEIHVREIYKIVREQYPELCDAATCVRRLTRPGTTTQSGRTWFARG